MSQRLYRRSEGGCWYVYLGRDSAGEKVARSTGCRDRRAAEQRAVELERQFRAPQADAAPAANYHAQDGGLLAGHRAALRAQVRS